LNWAVWNGDNTSVEKLLKMGARSDIKDDKGKTAIDLASDKSKTLNLFNMKKHAIILEPKLTEIIQKKCDDETEKESSSVRENFKNFIQDNEISIDTSVSDGNTSLHLFAKNGLGKLVKLAVEMGASVNTKNDEGDTPLHLAVRAGKTAAVKFLISRKDTSVDIKNNLNETVRTMISLARKDYQKFLNRDEYSDSTINAGIDDDYDLDYSDDESKKSKKKKKKKKKILLVRRKRVNPAQIQIQTVMITKFS